MFPAGLPRLAALVAILFVLGACSDEARRPEAVITGPATAQLGGVVQLDAGQSSDPEGGSLSYQWRLAQLPPNSATAFNDTTIANPSFLVDVPGEFVVELVVFAGSRISEAARLVISVAECGARPPQVIAISADPAAPSVGDSVRLTAQTGDPDNEADCNLGQHFDFSWEIVGLPTGSVASLNNPTLPAPVFQADRSGTFTVELTLTDSAGLSSQPTSFDVEVALCGEARPTITSATADPVDPTLGETVVLSAEAGDADNAAGCDAGQSVGVDWTLRSAPAASTAEIERANLPEAWFVPDVAGLYAIGVVARDSTGRVSDVTEITITAGDADVEVAVTATPEAGLLPLTVELGCTATGDGPLQYGWSFGNGAVSTLQNPTFTYDQPGVFTASCLAVDVDGDSGTASVEIEVQSDTAPSIEANASVRAGVAPLDVTFDGLVRGGEGEVTYSWDFGDGNSSTESAPTNTFADPGNYAVTVTVTDGDGDSGSDLIEIAVGSDAQPAIAAAATPSVGIAPLDVQLEAFVAGGNPPLTFEWNFGEGDPDDIDSTLQNPQHTYETDSDETFTAVVTVRDVDGDEETAEVAVVVDADVVVGTTNAAATVAAGRVPLLVGFSCTAAGGNGPLVYSWTFGDGTTSGEQNPSHVFRQPDSYTATCTATDANGDRSSDTVGVTAQLNHVPSVALSANVTSGVAPLQVTFTSTASGGDAPMVRTWDFGTGEIEPDGANQDGGDVATVSETRTFAAGTFQVGVAVADPDGDTARATIVISVDPDQGPLTMEVVASANPPGGIADNGVPLPVTFSANVSGGNPPYTYAWELDDLDGGAVDSMLASPTVPLPARPADPYNATVVVRDVDGDTPGPAGVTVIVLADAQPNLGPLTPVAPQGLAPLLVNFTCPLATPGNAPHTFAWSFGDGQSSTQQDPAHTYAAAGNYTATCTVTDADGDPDSDSITGINAILDTSPVPTILGGPLTGLHPLSVNFDSSVVGGNGAIGYVWDFGDDGIPNHSGVDGLGDDPLAVTYNAPGSYSVVLLATDADGDMGQATTTVVVGSDDVPTVAIAAVPTSGVAPLLVQFGATVAGGNGTSTLAWDLDGVDQAGDLNGLFDDSIAASPTWTYGPGTVIARVQARDADGDPSNVATVNINAFADFDIIEVLVDHEPDEENPLFLAPLAVGFSCQASDGTLPDLEDSLNAPIAYRWSFGDGASSTVQHPNHTYAAAGTYSAVCTATDADGDQASGTRSVLVNADTTPLVTLTATPTSGSLGPGGGLSVVFTSNVAGGNGTLVYEWSFGGAGTLVEGPGIDPGANDPTETFRYTDAGTFVATLTVRDEGGIAPFSENSSDNETIAVRLYTPPSVVASAVPSSGIAPLSVNLFANAAGGEPPLRFEWDFTNDGIVDSTAQNPTFVYGASNDPIIAEVVVFDALDEPDDATVAINVAADDLPIITSYPLPSHPPRAPALASFTCFFSSPNEPNRVQWVFGDGQTTTVNNASSPQSTSHSYGVAGSYATQCIVTDGDGDTTSAGNPVNLAANSVPSVALLGDPTSGVAQFITAFTAVVTGGNAPLTYDWNFGNGDSVDDGFPNEFAIYTSGGTFLASVEVCDTDGDCDAETLTISVEADLTPSVSAHGSPESGVSPLMVQLSAGATSGNLPLTIEWSFSDGTSDSGENVTHTFIAPDGGHFTAVATVTDSDGDVAVGVDTVHIDVTAPNRPPLAIIAADECNSSPLIQLGSASLDPDGTDLSYTWSLLAIEPGAAAVLSSTTIANPVLSVDQDGFYEVLLEVSDGTLTGRAQMTLQLDTTLIVTTADPDREGFVGDPFELSVEAVNGCGAPYVELCFAFLESPQGTGGNQATFDDFTVETGEDGVAVASGLFGPFAGSTPIDVCFPAFCGERGNVIVDGDGGGFEIPPDEELQCQPLFDFNTLCAGPNGNFQCTFATGGTCDDFTHECQPPSCEDDARNLFETDIDCGGPDCPACSGGEFCEALEDCAPPFACTGPGGVCAMAGVWFVDQSRTSGRSNGLGWEHAFLTLQDGIDAAGANGGGQVWVADTGFYRPTGDLNRDVSFRIDDPGVELFGGFAGDELELGARVPGERTTLSGDLGGNDAADCTAVPVPFGSSAENTRHVVEIDGAADAILDGFVIRGGNADGATGDGGAIRIVASNAVWLNDLVIECNLASNRGGGVWLDAAFGEADDLSITESTLRFNAATQGGGGIYLNGLSGAAITNAQFEGNQVLGGRGGGLFLEAIPAAGLDVSGGTFLTNRAHRGGGAFLLNASDVTFDTVTFDSNSATASGGGLEAQNSNDLQILTSDFNFNTVSLDCGSGGSFGCLDFGGGGLKVHGSAGAVVSGLVIQATDFSNNTVANGFGGGGMIQAVEQSSISDCLFDGNSTNFDGGGLFVRDVDDPIILTTPAPSLLIEDTEFVANTASSGGGLELLSADVRVDGCTFFANSVLGGGGGAFVFSLSEAWFSNSLFEQNLAAAGGAISYNTSAARFTNITATRNCATLDGQANAITGVGLGGPATFVNSILWDQSNCAVTTNPMVDGSPMPNISFSDVETGIPGGCDGVYADPGSTNICADPRFFDSLTAPGDYFLMPDSPAIDRGTDTAPSFTPADIDGVARVDIPGVGAALSDMGAYEFFNDCLGQTDFTACREDVRDDAFCFAGGCFPVGCGSTACNASAPHFPLADTGQTTCFDSAGDEIVCCSDGGTSGFCGQDADVGWDAEPGNTQAVRWTADTSTGERVVTDTVTGIIWQGCLAGETPLNCAGEPLPAGVNWTEAVQYCRALDWGGQTDWRLPDRFELQSLLYIEADVFPNIYAGAFPNTSYGIHWSSTVVTLGNGSTEAYTVELNTGVFNRPLSDRVDSFDTPISARCVRGDVTPLPAGTRFTDGTGGAVDGADLTLADHFTGLGWTRNDAPSDMPWPAAVEYCDGLDLGGFNDWRLPNITELHTMFDFRLPPPNLHALLNPGDRIDVWSGTPLNFFLVAEIAYGFFIWHGWTSYGSTFLDTFCVRDL